MTNIILYYIYYVSIIYYINTTYIDKVYQYNILARWNDGKLRQKEESMVFLKKSGYM